MTDIARELSKPVPIAVLTPLHAAAEPFIEEAYQSLRSQTRQDWAWWVLENHGGTLPPSIASDARVRLIRHCDGDGIGALKGTLAREAIRYGAEQLVELDADDLLLPTALERVSEAFETAGADFVYSDAAYFKDLGEGIRQASWKDYPFRSDCGWESYPVTVGEDVLHAMRAPEATAHNLRLVDWAPDHVRAWRASAYAKVGGHDASMAVADDHDLAVRMFLAGSTFHHIHECLYLYRVHGANTVSTRNAAIRAGTGRVYERSIWPLAEHWCKEKELLRIDLGGALDCPPGYTPVDRNPGPGVLVADLEGRWPMADSSVGILRAHDALEHFKDPVHTMNEAHRVLAPGGFFMISVPSTSGKGAWCDPTHKSWWNDLSFRYYTSARFARYVPAFHGRFQTSRVIEWYPSEWHREADVPYVEAHLFCVKDGFRAMGEWGWG